MSGGVPPHSTSGAAAGGRDALRSLRRSDLRPRDRQRRLRVADVRYRPVAYRTRSRLGEECRRNVPRGHRRHGRASVPAVGRPPARRLPDGAVSPRGPERSERAPATGPPGARRAPPIRGRDRLPTRRVRLLDAASYRYAGPGTAVPFTPDADLPLLRAKIKARGRRAIPARLLLDTGASGLCLILTVPFVEQHGLASVAPAIEAPIGTGLAGELHG